MVDGINTYGSGASLTGVVQQAATPPKKEGGAATEEPKVRFAETKAEPAQTINNLLRTEVKGQGDFVSQAEAILNKALSLKSANTKLSIDVDNDSGLFVYKGVDKQSGEVVSQFPAEEVLALIAYYREAEGLVIDQEA